MSDHDATLISLDELRSTLIAYQGPPQPRPRTHVRPARRTLTRRRAVVAAAVAVALAAPALALSGVLGSLFGLSNAGTPASTERVDLGDLQILHDDHVDLSAGVTLLATRDATAFYITRTDDGRTCLLTGPAGGTEPARITINTPCERNFPSATRPILGYYVLARAPRSDVQSIFALRGLAADGVASVDAVDASGRVLMQAPVTDNVYSTDHSSSHAPGGASVTRIEARDSAGNVVHSVTVPQPSFGR
jgi:hypothetical protein